MKYTNLYEALLEHDLDPFILFDSNGKVKKYNQEAEYLFNFVSVKELFELALNNASKEFGFEKKYISIQYNKLNFYAMLIGYIDDNEIALRLYKVVSNKLNNINNDRLKLVNIFSLIEISKNSILMNSQLNISEIYDVSIPEIKLDINNFLLCLNEIFTYFKYDEKLTLEVFIKIGEYEIIENKRYKIVSLRFISNNLLESISKIEKYALKLNTTVFVTKNMLTLELPLIL